MSQDKDISGVEVVLISQNEKKVQSVTAKLQKVVELFKSFFQSFWNSEKNIHQKKVSIFFCEIQKSRSFSKRLNEIIEKLQKQWPSLNISVKLYYA